MEENAPLAPAEAEEDEMAELRAQLAALIRHDSQELGQVTPSEALGPFFAGLGRDQVEAVLADLFLDEQNQDLKALRTSEATYFFYSEQYLALPQAEEQALTEEAKARIAARVRQESKELNRLTAATSLAPILSELELEADVLAIVPRLEADEAYGDVRALTLSDGSVYLYSERHITANYAALLARMEEDDPLAAIAETVREESRVYPRPTNVSLFTVTPFDMDPSDVEQRVAALLQDPGYDDIRQIRASTGAVYLYSEQYLKGDLARSLVDWQEVGQYENP